jgi:hypothetical protein
LQKGGIFSDRKTNLWNFSKKRLSLRPADSRTESLSHTRSKNRPSPSFSKKRALYLKTPDFIALTSWQQNKTP